MFRGKRSLSVCVGLFFIFFLSPLDAQSQITKVEGLMANGALVIIGGTGFGEKVPASPILWDQFENGINGGHLSASPNWTKYDGSGSTTGGYFSNVLPYSGSLSAHNRITGPNAANPVSAAFNTSYFIFPDADEVYYSYMSRYTVSGDSYGQLKHGRSNTGTNRYSGDGFIAISDGYVLWNAGAGTIYPDGRYFSGLNSSNWTRHEIYKRNSLPAGTANGETQFFVGGVTKRYQNIVTRVTGAAWRQNSVLLGLMLANAKNNGDHRIWIDDVYVDKTRARVELCVGSTWNSRNHCNIQIPSKWSPSSITVAANTSNFTSGQTVYLYVVDAVGQANSSGYPVVIGGGSVPASIAPPAGFQLQ